MSCRARFSFISLNFIQSRVSKDLEFRFRNLGYFKEIIIRRTTSWSEEARTKVAKLYFGDCDMRWSVDERTSNSNWIQFREKFIEQKGKSIPQVFLPFHISGEGDGEERNCKWVRASQKSWLRLGTGTSVTHLIIIMLKTHKNRESEGKRHQNTDGHGVAASLRTFSWLRLSSPIFF